MKKENFQWRKRKND